jgi:NAD(P)-dependent dehydrogenase (short-subunit alcohol dehydrogenase family)
MNGQLPVALVTGANRGIGFEVCRQLGRLGYSVLLAARDADKARAAETLAGEGLRVTGVVLDVSDDWSVARALGAVERELGALDVLVNNAGGGYDPADRPTDFSSDGAQQVFEVNLFGPWRVTSAFLPLLVRSARGRVVNVSSAAGSFGGEYVSLSAGGGANAGYGVSKAALNALTVKLAAALRGTGVLVNAVCPGWTATDPGGLAQGARPVSDGAASVVWAATLPDDGPTGGFFRDGQPLPW